MANRPKNKADIKSSAFLIKVTPTEHETITQIALGKGLTVSEYVRQSALNTDNGHLCLYVIRKVG